MFFDMYYYYYHLMIYINNNNECGLGSTTSLGVDCLLTIIKYILRLDVNFNNWPMVTIILLYIICCPTSSLTSREMGVGSTFGCSIVDGNPAHSVDQDGSRTITTSCYASCIFSSFCNSWTVFAISCLNFFSLANPRVPSL
jgi:hypothetical protein